MTHNCTLGPSGETFITVPGTHGDHVIKKPGGSSTPLTKTLRDEFAMAALVPLLDGSTTFPSNPEESDANYAKRAYEVADAMLKEKAKRDG